MKNYKIKLNFKNRFTKLQTIPKDVYLYTILDELKQDIDLANHDWLDNDDYVVERNFLINRLEFDKTTGKLKSLEFITTKDFIYDAY